MHWFCARDCGGVLKDNLTDAHPPGGLHLCARVIRSSCQCVALNEQKGHKRIYFYQVITESPFENASKDLTFILIFLKTNTHTCNHTNTHTHAKRTHKHVYFIVTHETHFCSTVPLSLFIITGFVIYVAAVPYSCDTQREKEMELGPFFKI